MESGIIWFLTALISVLIVLPYYLKFRKSQREHLQRKKEAQALGLDRPHAQYPFIDVNHCIGCGSCVEACPEGDVLGVVWGKATVINAMRCVGHGFCEQVCPVGAIEVGLGDIKQRTDIPVLSEHFETNIPGIYIVGELSGFSLIRNAIIQGNQAVTHIAGTSRRSTDPEVLDVLIVGAGPAGVSAALTAIQHGLSYVILEQHDLGGTILKYPRRKLVMTRPVEIPLYGMLEKTEIEKEELLEIWYRIQREFRLKLRTGERVVDIQRQEDGSFRIISTGGEYRALHVVLALGRRGTPRKLGVPGEALPKVLYQLIDAQSYQHMKLLVVGGGDSAVEAAIGLARQKGNTVHISYRKPRFFRIKQKNQERIQQLIRQKKIFPLFNSRIVEITPNTVILEQEGQRLELPNDFVFIFIGGEPPFDFLKKIGIQFGPEVAVDGTPGSS
ncbi:MAG: NAD(P)-binding domain-containing protein [Calditrichaeota bacterium]|nr:NAD(P)-binding domain-containing protein [Calditrichota bacterium]